MRGFVAPHLFRSAVRAHSDRIAVRFFDEAWSYSRLGEEANQVANALRGWGLQRGDRVALYSLNIPEYLTTYFGTHLAGLATTLIGVLLPSGASPRGC